MKIYGLEKLSMVDFEGHLCATVFTGGCNFCCPFCHNADLVKINNLTQITEQDFFDYLTKRKTVLDSVCVSGGEPTIHPDLVDFIKKIKEMGFLVKLDTNGTNFDMLKKLVDQKLVDYVAMDIKNSKQMYEKTAGAKVNMRDIEKSVDFLRNGNVEYELRTTLVGEHHTLDSIKEMAEWLAGADKLFLQHFVDSGTCIQSGLKEIDRAEAEKFQQILQKKIKNVYLRGY